jgi:hypothetical protein
MLTIFNLLSVSVATSVIDFGSNPSEILNECEGDCDNDSDCVDTLLCGHRNVGDDLPPGCVGIAKSGNDYCYYPVISSLGANPSGMLSECEGDCDNHSDCLDNLLCLQRERGDPIPPGCVGTAKFAYDYCYDPRVGLDSSDASPSGSLGECEGDCDNDSDCSDNLQCWQREDGDPIPPGCVGTAKYDYDYCYEPGIAVSNLVLSECEGDCDYDSDCLDNLQCYQREVGDPLPPGCVGDVESGYDYCYNPEIAVSNLVRNECEGDCDSDDDCTNNLLCWQRDNGDPAPPGCDGNAKLDYDYCYDPAVEN